MLTPIDDGPFVWKSRGAPDWEPPNYDKKFHGMVPLRLALAHSYNAAAARLGTDLGVERVLDNVRKLGVERELRPFASTLLGAVEMSPFEVAQMYQTIASGGFRSPLRAIRDVTTQEGKPLQRYPLAVEQAFAPEPIYLLAAAMQDVVREGTGQGLKSYLPPEIAVAGKTGTTDEQRDAWFAGFTGDRLAVVWVGYDDNRAARLSGSAAALPIWGDLMTALSPEPLAPPGPSASSWCGSTRRAGCAAAPAARARVELPFVQGSAPTRSRAVLRRDGRRGRGGRRGRAGGRRDRQARQELARAPVRPMRRLLLVLRPGLPVVPAAPDTTSQGASPGAAARRPAAPGAAARALRRRARKHRRRRPDGQRARRHCGRQAAERRRVARARAAHRAAQRAPVARARAVRLRQRDYAQAENLAVRSNTLAGSDARSARGEPAADRRRARTALARQAAEPSEP